MNDEFVYVDDRGREIPGQFSAPPNQLQRSDKADLIDKIKPDAIVEVIRHRLMGEEFVNGKWQRLPQLKNSAISEVGAWDIANLMLSVSSQNVALSRVDNDLIRRRTLNIVKTAQLMIDRNWKEYGITSLAQKYFVHEIIMSNTLFTLKQPENGGIRDLIKGTTSENRNINVEQKARSWGLLRGR